MGFGFAPPIQFMQPPKDVNGDPATSMPNPTGAPTIGQGIGNVRNTLQQLGILKPPMPGANLPSVLPGTSPDIGSSAALDSAASGGAADSAAGLGSSAMDVGSDAALDGAASAAAGAAPEAAAASGAGIGDLIASLFI